MRSLRDVTIVWLILYAMCRKVQKEHVVFLEVEISSSRLDVVRPIRVLDVGTRKWNGSSYDSG